MTKDQLERVAEWFRAEPRRITALQCANTLCVGSAAAAFFYGVLVNPGLRDPKLTLRLILTCGIPFVILSAARHGLDLPRPFEIYDMEPLLPRERPGRSFPSRHVFSICVIGTCFCFLTPWIGAALLALGAVLAAMRVISGVHFPRDVIVGAIFGILSGLIGFALV